MDVRLVHPLANNQNSALLRLAGGLNPFLQETDRDVERPAPVLLHQHHVSPITDFDAPPVADSGQANEQTVRDANRDMDVPFRQP